MDFNVGEQTSNVDRRSESRSERGPAARLCRRALSVTWFLFAWILASAGIGLLYSMSVKAEFVARVDILIEPQSVSIYGSNGERRFRASRKKFRLFG